MDEALGLAIGGLRLADDWQVRALATAETNTEDAAAKAGRRAYLDKKLGRLRRLLIDGDLTQAEYRAEKDAIDAERVTLAPTGATVDLERVATLLSDLGSLWSDALESERKEIAGRIFDAVYYDLDNPENVYAQLNKALHPLWSALPRVCTTSGSDGIRVAISYIRTPEELDRRAG